MDFLDIATRYKEVFIQDQEAFLFQIGSLSSIRGVLVQVYYQLVREKKCDGIENLGSEDKQALWHEAKRISSRQEQKYLIEVCKALQGFGAFIQL